MGSRTAEQWGASRGAPLSSLILQIYSSPLSPPCHLRPEPFLLSFPSLVRLALNQLPACVLPISASVSSGGGSQGKVDRDGPSDCSTVSPGSGDLIRGTVQGPFPPGPPLLASGQCPPSSPTHSWARGEVQAVSPSFSFLGDLFFLPCPPPQGCADEPHFPTIGHFPFPFEKGSVWPLP